LILDLETYDRAITCDVEKNTYKACVGIQITIVNRILNYMYILIMINDRFFQILSPKWFKNRYTQPESSEFLQNTIGEALVSELQSIGGSWGITVRL